MRRRAGWLWFIVEILLCLTLYICALVASRHRMTVFLAVLTVGWHTMANLYCSFIAAYRFKNPSAKYIEIKNKFIRKLFVRNLIIERASFKDKSDERTNIIGLVLNIINTILFVFFEVLLLLPKIPSEPYIFHLPILGRTPGHHTVLDIELHYYNHIISAEGGKYFALLMVIICFVFAILFSRQIKEHRRKIERNTVKTPRMKPFKKIEWYSPLYDALVDLSDRRNNKKHKFWYDAKKLEQIENIVKSASENAELKLETRGNKLVSFTVTDTLNNSVRFTGFFIYNRR